VPAKYTTETEEILVSPASQKWVKKKADPSCLSADPDACLVWCLVEVAAQYRTVTKQVRVGCADGYTDNGDDCTRAIDIPAKYGTRTYQKLVTPASTDSREIPAQYGTRTYKKLVEPARSETVEIPAKYATRTYQKLVKEATSETIDVPARYETRTYKKLVSPATTEVVEIPAKYSTRSYQKLVTPATTETVDVPARYETRTYKKLVEPARTEVVEIPAKYETRTYKKLVSPATTETIDIPAKYTTRTYKKLASAASVEEVPCGKSSIVEGINFQSGSANLEQSSYAEIAKLERMLKDKTNITAKLVGHTDSQGGEAANRSLSQNRAKAVYDVLVNSGIDASRLSYEGMGEASPVASNATASGRRTNRRTEFITYGDDGSGAADCNKYETRSYQKLVSPATTEVVDIPARYETRTYKKLVTPASTEVVDIPARYETRTYKKLATPAGVTTTEIPAQYKSVTKQVLVKEGGFTEMKEVVCAADITTDLYKRVQRALLDRGYNIGSAGVDGVIGGASNRAIEKFQRDNNLPIGNLNIETLTALGIERN